jgi:tetratricopeptide (TPR) repeat protein
MNYPTAQSGPGFDFQISKGSGKLVLFFSALDALAGKFQYWKTGKSLGTHCLFLSDDRKRWYQDGVPGLGKNLDETIANIRLWARALGASEIHTFGQSMGAHGAILYGSKLGARVLAFGAETTLRLEASCSRQHLPDDAGLRYPDLHDVIAAAEQPIFTFAGERDPVDLLCLSKAYGLPNHHPRTMIGHGHSIVSYLKGAGRLVPLLEAFVANREIPLMNEEGSALTHPGFAGAYYDLFAHMKANRFAPAAEAGRTAIAAYQRSDQAYYLTAKALLSLRQPAEALSLIQCAAALAPGVIGHRFLMGRCLAGLGEQDRAIATYEAILADQPDFANAFNQLAGIHYARGEFLRALEASRRAIELEPDTPIFLHLRSLIEKKLLDGPGGQIPPPAPPPRPIRFKGLLRTLRNVVTHRP